MAARTALILICTILISSPFIPHGTAMEYSLEGNFGVTARLADVNGNEAKFNEYRDIRDGLYAHGLFMYDSEKYFLDLEASDIGYDTQSYAIAGGSWGSFEYFFDYREIPHNYKFGAKTFYSGSGSDTLRGSPDPDIKNWSSFDYAVDRKTYATGFKLEMLRPFFFDVSASREEREGTKPGAAEGGIGFGNTIQVPEPIDYRTDMLKFEGGYSQNPLFVSAGLIYSQFGNDHEILHFENPFIGGNPNDALTLPPDNDYYKVFLKNAVKLPLNSKLHFNVAYSETSSDTALRNTYYGGGALNTITLSDPEFDGRIDNLDYDIYLTSSPVSFMDMKVYYQYHKRDNKSDRILTEDDDEILLSRLLDTRNEKYGLELGFRLPARLYLDVAYDRIDIKRDREDVTENTDDVYTVSLRWKGLDFMSLRAGYERVNRGADFHSPDVAPEDPEFIHTFVKRFDVAPKKRDTYKVSADIYPLENLNSSIAYKYKKTDFTDTVLGLREAKSDEFSIDIDYTIGTLVKIAAYFDYEKIRHCQFQRELPFNAASGFNPGTPPEESSFNWTARRNDKTYDYGIGSDINIIDKILTLKLQYDYIRSNGDVDYAYLLGTNPLPDSRTQNNIDISDWDDYRLRTYLVKVIYQAMKKISITAGYAHEDFHYSDALVNGYRYTLGNPVNTYLTGACKDLSYSANIAFFNVVYSF